MANTALTADVVAKEALTMLENELGVLGTFHRAHEDEFASEVNGFKKGATIRIRRPADFTVRTTATMNLQDAIEGRTTLTVDKQIGVDFAFTSLDMTLSISKLSERFIRPAMSSIVNEMARDCFSTFYQGVYNWVGTPGTAINSYADFALGPQRLDEMAVPTSDRYAALQPSDHWALLGSQTGLYITDAAKGAYRDGSLGRIGGVETYMSQVLPTHTTGSRIQLTTPITAAASGDQSVSYDTAKNVWTQDLVTTGYGSTTLTAGDVFTIADLYMVNPKTKASTGILQQFVVTTAHTNDDTDTIVISPPIITSGPHQTVVLSTGTFASNVISDVGVASTAYKQNLVYHKNAFGLACVPMELPQGAPGAAQQSYKGFSVRVIPVYDGVNDISKWRLDMLYGRTVLDPRLATRINGT
jgi:hypothetical protein